MTAAVVIETDATITTAARMRRFRSRCEQVLPECGAVPFSEQHVTTNKPAARMNGADVSGGSWSANAAAAKHMVPYPAKTNVGMLSQYRLADL